MKHMLALGGTITALTLGASSYLAADSRTSPLDSPTVVSAPTESAVAPVPTSPARMVEHVTDLVGAYLLAREGDDLVRLRIQEFVWGITKDANLGVAILKATKDNGQAVDYDRTELFERLAYSPEELGNTYFQQKDGSRVWTEQISYRIDESGLLATLEWTGRDRNARAFHYDDITGQLTYFDGPNPLPPTPVCCRQVTVTECLTANGCTVGCAGPSSCGCTTPAGSSCYLQTGPQCKGACGGTCGHTGSCGGPSPGCECH